MFPEDDAVLMPFGEIQAIAREYLDYVNGVHWWTADEYRTLPETAVMDVAA